MAEIPRNHFQLVAKFLRMGTVVPFLGAGVNLCDRAHGSTFALGRFLPSGRELADNLAQKFFYPADDVLKLLRVSQYVAVKAGEASLYDHLHTVFDHDYEPTSLHRFLARIPAVLRAQGQERYRSSSPPITTTPWSGRSGPQESRSTSSSTSPRASTGAGAGTWRPTAPPR